jgi:hypothetical protein
MDDLQKIFSKNLGRHALKALPSIFLPVGVGAPKQFAPRAPLGVNAPLGIVVCIAQ